MRKSGGSWLLFVVLISSCTTQKKYPAGLFSVDSLITAQATFLSEHQTALVKSTGLGSRKDQTTSVPEDVVAWKKELEIFSALDAINKPVNRTLYKTEVKSDSKSNLKVKSFTTEEKNLPVRFIKIYYQDVPGKIRLIEAQYEETNPLFRSMRSLTMEFQDINNKTLLTSYSILGGQKMFLGDTVQYRVKGALTIRN